MYSRKDYACVSGQAAELSDLADERGDGGELRQPVGAHGLVVVHHEHVVEVAVDGGRRPAGELARALSSSRCASSCDQRPSGRLERGRERRLGRLGEQRRVDGAGPAAGDPWRPARRSGCRRSRRRRRSRGRRGRRRRGPSPRAPGRRRPGLPAPPRHSGRAGPRRAGSPAGAPTRRPQSRRRSRRGARRRIDRALQLELVEGRREQALEREAQLVLEGDAHDAHRGAAQPVGVA